MKSTVRRFIVITVEEMYAGYVTDVVEELLVRFYVEINHTFTLVCYKERIVSTHAGIVPLLT